MEETRLETMKNCMRILSATAVMLAAAPALAGPPVEVTFRNLGTESVKLQLTNANETSTYQIARPAPLQEVQPGSSITFSVQRLVSPDTNGANPFRWGNVHGSELWIQRKLCLEG